MGDGSSSSSIGNTRCTICGSRFADRKCYFCQKKICTSCVTPSDVTGSSVTIKCLNCERKKVTRLSFATVIKRNLHILGILGGLWLFTVLPVPFLSGMGYENTMIVLQPILIITAAMVTPFVFMFIAWQRRAPASDR